MYLVTVWHTSIDKGTIGQTRVHPDASTGELSFPITLIPKRCPRSAWTPSSRDVKTHARSCSTRCRNHTTNSTTSYPISKTHHTDCGPRSATPGQKQKLTDIETASSPLLCPLAVIVICFALLRQQWTENLSKSGQPKPLIGTIYSDVNVNRF